MNAGPLAFLFGGLLAAVACAQGSGGRGGELPPRPASGVHDPSSWLTPIERRQLERDLLELRERDGVDLKVAVLDRAPGVPGQPYAAKLAAAWGESAAHGVVVHVRNSDGPWLAVGGALTETAGRPVVDESLREAARRISAERDEHRRVMSAVEELSDFLRFLGNRGLHHEERRKTQRLENELMRTRRALLIRLALLGGGVALVGAIAGVFAWMRHWRRHRAPLRFPETVWRVRLGAPFSGGSDAVARFGEDRPRS